jgi:C4-type Zn-finger protein
MFNRLLAFTLTMSENLGLCPKCKEGHLRDAGGVIIKREIEPPFRQTGSMRERICDQCGHRQIDQYLNEYGEPASELLGGTPTKANPKDKREE